MIKEIGIPKAYYVARAETWIQDIPHGSLEINEYRHLDMDRLVHELKIAVLKDTVEITPSSWWQHFKKDCFPKWALKKWPVKYVESCLVIKACPDLDTFGPTIVLNQGGERRWGR